jgi:hypothetical protein
MKVKDLIEVLKNFNPERKVVYWDEDVCDYQDVKYEYIKEKFMYPGDPDEYLDEWQITREINKKRKLKLEKVVVLL